MNKLLFFILALLLGLKVILGQTVIVQKDELLFEKGLLLEKLAKEDLNLDRTIYSNNNNIDTKLDSLNKIRLCIRLCLNFNILKKS